jgi:hypothetical protein
MLPHRQQWGDIWRTYDLSTSITRLANIWCRSADDLQQWEQWPDVRFNCMNAQIVYVTHFLTSVGCGSCMLPTDDACQESVSLLERLFAFLLRQWRCDSPYESIASYCNMNTRTSAWSWRTNVFTFAGNIPVGFCRGIEVNNASHDIAFNWWGTISNGDPRLCIPLLLS